jgi:hypothetical protein
MIYFWSHDFYDYVFDPFVKRSTPARTGHFFGDFLVGPLLVNNNNRIYTNRYDIVYHVVNQFNQFTRFVPVLTHSTRVPYQHIRHLVFRVTRMTSLLY